MKYIILLLTTLTGFSQPSLVNGEGGGISNPAFRNSVFPSQTGQAGKYAKTDGTNVSWESVTGGTWGSITGTLASQTDLQAELVAKSNRVPILFDNFARYSTGTIFTHNSQTPSLGGNGWRMHTPGGSNQPTIVDNALMGKGLAGTGAELYYMATDIGVGVPIRSLVLDLSLIHTGTAGPNNGFTVGMGPNSLVPVSTNIGLQTGMLHMPFSSSGTGMSITTAPSATFREVSAEGNSTTNFSFYPEDVTAGLANNNRYRVEFRFPSNDLMIFTIAGKSWIFRDSGISDFAINSIFLETAGPTGYANYWIIHKVAINDDSNQYMGGIDQTGNGQMFSKNGTISLEPSQKLEVIGQSAGFLNGGRAANVAIASSDFIYSEKGFRTTALGVSSGDYYTPVAASSTNASNSPSGTDQNWFQVGSFKLLNVGDWFECSYDFKFPNTNSKQFKFATTGTIRSDLTFPAFTDSGVGTLKVRQAKTSTISNMVTMELEIVTDSTLGIVKHWIRSYEGSDGLGNSSLQIKFTGVATGDGVLLSSNPTFFIKNP